MFRTFRSLLFLMMFTGAVAHASTMTYNITFTASGPYTASGSYTLTFDPTQTYTNATNGFTVNSLNAGSQGASGFSFNPSSSNGYLTIGGLVNGVNGLQGVTDDYVLLILQFNTPSPLFYGFYVDHPSGSYDDSTVSGTITPVAAVTPEPSSLALLATGLLGAGFIARRRFAAARQLVP